MTVLETKRAQVELSKVKSAREELELRIMEKEEEILRIRDTLKVQDERIIELSEKLKQ